MVQNAIGAWHQAGLAPGNVERIMGRRCPASGELLERTVGAAVSATSDKNTRAELATHRVKHSFVVP